VDWELLAGLPQEEVRRILQGARRRRFSRGEVLFHEGDPAATVHLLARGRVAVRVTTPLGDVCTLDILGPGGVLGELALLCPGAPRSATAVALELTETMTIDEASFSALRDEHREVADTLVQVLTARVLRLNERLVEALYVPADVRIIRRLLDLVALYGDVVPLTQDDLAELAGTTRSTVNRVLRREERTGSLTLARGKIEVRDREALAARAR
jgi:CRP-like cAMP-binding protein